MSNMDTLLKEELTPNEIPDIELNNKIIEEAGKAKSKKNFYGMQGLARVAAIALCILCIGGPITYAAGNIIKDVFITDHAVSQGNTEYVDDEAIAAPEEQVDVEVADIVQGGPNDKWNSKRVEVISDTYKNTYYMYSSMTDAFEDAGMKCWIQDKYELEYEATYVYGDYGDVIDKCMNVCLKYEEGTVFYSQSIMTGNVADDMTYSIKLANTGNKRTYNEFTLVDEVKDYGEGEIVTTYVLLSYDGYNGYFAFENVSEEGIHTFLDSMLIGE